MTSKTHPSIRRLAPLAMVLVALAVAACGSNASSSSTSSPAAASTQSSSSSSAAAAPPTTSSSAKTKNGIPQGPGAGDNDADNQGGPSDGDGNL